MSRRNEVVTGLFVLLGLAVVVAGSLWLSESRWRGEFRIVEGRFGSVGQLRPGNSVTIRGVEVGTVERISLEPEGGVRVAFRIRADAPLPEDPLVHLHPLSLFGGWAASIVPASEREDVRPDTTELPEGVLPGVTSADFARLTDHTAAIATNLATITDRLELAFDEEAARDFARALDNFEAASEELVRLVGRQRETFEGFGEDLAHAGETLRGAASDLDSTLSRLEAATAEGRLGSIFENAEATAVSLNEAGRETRAAVEELRGTIERADSALAGARSLLDRMNRGEGALGRLATDPVLYEDMRATLTELAALLDDLRRNPGRYFNFSIF